MRPPLLNRFVQVFVNRPALLAIGATPTRGGSVGSELPEMRPHVGSRRWGFTHYNVVLPRLPEPHRFMACAVFVGQPAARAFDLDHAVVGSPRRTATVGTGTAETAPATFAALSAVDDCRLTPDGAHMHFGSLLEIDRDGVSVRVRVDQPGLRIELELDPSAEAACWFARSPLYEHVGIPATYTGTLEDDATSTAIEGTCSLEHARGVSLHLLLDRRVPGPLKLPLSFFAYHVVDLGDGRLLLLTHTEALGSSLMRTAHVVEPGRRAETLDGTVRFQADRTGGRTVAAPDGHLTDVPGSMSWRVGDRIALQVIPDTELIYGIGTGWMGGARVTGTVDGQEVDARAYVEHIDRRSG